MRQYVCIVQSHQVNATSYEQPKSKKSEIPQISEIGGNNLASQSSIKKYLRNTTCIWHMLMSDI